MRGKGRFLVITTVNDAGRWPGAQYLTEEQFAGLQIKPLQHVARFADYLRAPVRSFPNCRDAVRDAGKAALCIPAFLAGLCEAQEILAQLFFIELIGRRTVECRQLPHGPQIGLLCASADPAKLQIARHPLTQAPAATPCSQRTTAIVRPGT